VVVCLELGADLHMAQLMPLPLTVSCFSKIQIGFTFLVPAHLGSPEKRAVKWVYVCVGETFVFMSYLAHKLQTCYVGMTVLLYSTATSVLLTKFTCLKVTVLSSYCSSSSYYTFL